MEASVQALDNNVDVQALLGRDFGAIAHERAKIEQNTRKSVESIWQNINRFRSVTSEVRSTRPNPRRTNEIQGLIAEVLKGLDEEQASCEQELKLFTDESKDVLTLQRDLKDGDRVKGFDLEENMDLDLLIDLNKYQAFIEDKEQAMMDDFYSSCEMLMQKRDLEVQAVELNDVVYCKAVGGSTSVHR
jgi:hypothetical protein